MATLADRFEAKVDRSGKHHLWQGSTSTSGTGQVRVDGQLHNAPRVAWELANGPLSDGARVRSCPDEPGCVNTDHLRIAETPKTARAIRSDRGSGSVRQVGENRWKLTIDVGRDRQGRRRRISRTIRGSRTDANRAMAALSVEVQEGERVAVDKRTGLTVDGLMDWYLTFARDVRGLERTTLWGYREVFDNWFKPRIGSLPADRLTPADIDEAFGQMRAAGKSHSRMNNARSALNGAYKWGRRHEKVRTNPMRGFEMPKSRHVPRPTVAPEVHELRALLEKARSYDPDLAPVLLLAATTGMRRGELSGLRRNRLSLNRAELRIERSISEIEGAIEDKPTKTHRNRTVRLDQATVAFLQEHLAAMDARAAACELAVPDDAFVFSIEPDCSAPMRPELMTRRTRQLRKHLGVTKSDFDANILAMRKWTSTELMDAGFNPTAVSSRQGHTVQVMLNNYSSRRASADQAAADHLGAAVFGESG